MKNPFRYLIPFGVGLLAAAVLAGVYLALVSWAESPKHAIEFFWDERWLVMPILIGFGVQTGLYSALKLHLHIPVSSSLLASPKIHSSTSRTSIGTGGATSTAAMVACCAHHLTDVLPILGLSAAASFLAEYQTTFMAIGLATNLIGIGILIRILYSERRAALRSRGSSDPRIFWTHP